jgi:rod shape-determining protein MreC
VPRNRSARVATLGSAQGRPQAPVSSSQTRAVSVVRRRVFVGALVLVSLTLVSVYFRESSGGLHSVQSGLATVLRPFEVAAERVARPFQDAANWVGGLADARSKNAKLQHEVDQWRQQAIQAETARRDNEYLRRLLHFRDSPRFPKDYTAIAARVIAQPSGQFDQHVVLSAGSNDGIQLHDPVVTADGLVGEVSKLARNVAQVQLLTDEQAAASATDLRTAASGIVRHGSSSGSALIMDRVTKDKVVDRGDVVISAGWRYGRLTSIYPRGIPIGRVTSVGQLDTDLYKQIEVQPFVDFGSLDSVLVLVKGTG